MQLVKSAYFKSLLLDGGILLYPTDTVYGLGCDAFNEDALQKLIELKGRKEENGFLVLVSNLSMIDEYVEVSDFAKQLSEAFHPGPLTLILPIKKEVSNLLTGSHGSLGVRIPNNVFCLELLNKFTGPIVSTSANIAGKPTLDTPEAILKQFGEKASLIDSVVNHETLPESKPSTLIDLSKPQPKLLREGAISREILAEKGFEFD